jgi:hypothetical protein
MAQNWFDEIAKALALAGSRRSFLKGMGLTFGGLAIGAFPTSSAAGGPQCQEYCLGHGHRGAAFGRCMASCQQNIDFGTCESDAECFHTGCSGQICSSYDVITTCEFICEYGCLAQAPCECLGNNGCGFRMTRELRDCFQACE